MYVRAPLHVISGSGFSSLCCITWVVACAATFAGCSTPCSDLADFICNCEPTELAQQACLQRVEAEAAGVAVTAREQQVCAFIAASGACTCDALSEGRTVACGLTMCTSDLDCAGAEGATCREVDVGACGEAPELVRVCLTEAEEQSTRQVCP